MYFSGTSENLFLYSTVRHSGASPLLALVIQRQFQTNKGVRPFIPPPLMDSDERQCDVVTKCLVLSTQSGPSTVLLIFAITHCWAE
jgi:hypothetical protein